MTSRLGYWVGGLAIVLAIAGAIAWFVLGLTSLGDRVEDLARVPIPGHAVVTLPAGKGALYYEPATSGQVRVPRLDVSLTAVRGARVALRPHGGSVSYDVRGHAGQSFGAYTLGHGGRYRVVVDGPARHAVLALGTGVGGRVVSSIVGALVLFFGGCAMGGALIAWTSTRRSRA